LVSATRSNALPAAADQSDIGRAARTLQLAVGLACAVIGAEVLILPSRFLQTIALPADGWVRAEPVLGVAFIAVGVCLCAIATLAVRRRIVVATLVYATLLLALVCALRLMANGWLEAALFGCSAAVLVIATLSPRSLRDSLTNLGLRLGRGWTVGRVSIGLVLIAVGLGAAAARHDWAATALWVSLGSALVVGVHLSPSRPLDVASVRVRVVFITAALTSGSLILASLAIATSAESAAIADARSDQRLTAGEVAHNMTQADSDYRGVVTTLAARGGFAALDSSQQASLLQGLSATNVYAFSTYDSNGQAIARSDDRALRPLPPQVVQDVDGSGSAVAALSTVPDGSRPALLFAAPYSSADATVAGFIVAELDTQQLDQALGSLASVGRSGTSVFVLDRDGATILHPTPASVDAASSPPSSAGGDSPQVGSTLRYRLNGVDYVGASAPVPTLGWSVVSAYPVPYALAGVRMGREWAFGVLILAAALSIVMGLILADRLVAPLNELGSAMDDLASEGSASPMPRSSLAEVQRLTELFEVMRNRLTLRTVERQRALDSAREAIRVRDEFMSIAAHELKTPVTATRGHAQLLLMQARRGQGLEPARLQNSLERINSQSHKLAWLIDQLLDVARLERGGLRIQPREVDLRDLIAEVMADRPEGDRIVVRTPDWPVIVNADVGRLEQVLGNLLDNAVKFSPPEAPIELDLSEPTSGTARLTVRDRGLGIPTEHLSQIFDRFHQAHADSHRSGFGLGLYIAKQIVDLHSGSIQVECPSSGGTRVWVDLPLAEAAARADGAA
jgi:signal transduction histidine kinase